MDLALDYKKSRAFDCSTCDSGMQRLRNCGGQYGEKSKTPMVVNDRVYRKCPRSMAFGREMEQYLVNLYFDCRENKVMPTSHPLMHQTAYCIDLFNFLDSLVNDYKRREHEKQMKEMKKQNAN